MKWSTFIIFISVLLSLSGIVLSADTNTGDEIHLKPTPMPPDARFAITGGYSLDWVKGGWRNYLDKGSSINCGIRFSVPRTILFYKVGFSYTRLKGSNNNPEMKLVNIIGGVDLVPLYRYRFTPFIGIELYLCIVRREGWEHRTVSDLALDGGFEFFPMKDRFSLMFYGLWHYNTMDPYDSNGKEIIDFEYLKYIEVRFSTSYYIF